MHLSTPPNQVIITEFPRTPGYCDRKYIPGSDISQSPLALLPLLGTLLIGRKLSGGLNASLNSRLHHTISQLHEQLAQ